MTEDEMKQWVDNASYEELLRKWRYAPSGNPFFANEMGDYYAEVMYHRKAEVGNAEAVRASKSIGWD